MRTPTVDFNVDRNDKTIHIQRQFAGDLDLVWAAWTRAELLDQWWAPKPWKAETQKMDFRPGGFWHYAMKGPEGERHYGRMDYEHITEMQSYSGTDSFCDEEGRVNPELPRTEWETRFMTHSQTQTSVHVTLRFETENDMDKLLEMGFREGFSAAFENLDAMLEKK